MILSVIVTKGGVGKTTVAVNLAAEYGSHGKKVLVVDLDAQGNATLSLTGQAPQNFSGRAVFDMIRAYGILETEKFIHKSATPNVDIIPSTLMTEQLNEQLPILSKMFGQSKFTFIKSALESVEDNYDIIIIDTPPARGPIVISAICASDKVLIPLKPEEYCLEALKTTIGTINQYKDTENPHVEVAGIVLSLVENTALTKSLRQMLLRSEQADLLMSSEIRKAQVINESTVMKMPVTIYKPNSNASLDFEALYKEISERMKV